MGPVLALGAVYAVAGKLGLSLAFANASATAVWPSTGIAVAALLLWGYRLWPGVFLGAFLVNLTTQGSAPTALGIAGGNTLEALAAAALVNRFASGSEVFERAPRIFKFIAFAALLSPLISASVGVTSLCLGGFAKWSHYFGVWSTWWLGDVVSNLIVAPLLIIWIKGKPRRLAPREVLEGAGLLVAMLWVGKIVFWGRNPFASSEYLIIPPLLWAAFRFGRRGAVTASFVLSSIALWGTLHGFGPFNIPDRDESLMLLQAFMGTITITALVLASVVAERDASEQRFRQVTENITEVFWMTDPTKHRMLYISPAYEKIWQRSCGSLYDSPRDWVDALHPDDRERVLDAALTRQVSGQYDEIYRILRPDGTIRWIRDRAFPVSDESGQAYRIVGIAQDITDQRELERQVLRTSSDERQRIGHDLHDSLGQHLAGIAYKTKALEEAVAAEAPALVGEVARIVSLLNEAIGQTRRLARGLAPVDVESNGLLAALQNLAAQTESELHLPCMVSSSQAQVAVSTQTSTALYHITQEAIHNAVTHGQARRIEIALESANHHLRLTIRDQGRGFCPESKRSSGMGLRIMQYRASSIGGNLVVQSQVNQGTEVRCVVPMAPERPGGALDNASDSGYS